MVLRLLTGRCGRQRTCTGVTMCRNRTMKYRLFLLTTIVLIGIFVYKMWTSSRSDTNGIDIDTNLHSDLQQHSTYIDLDRKHSTSSFGTGSVQDYCNSPFKPTTGSEGTTPNGFFLRMVHVFIRHGDRTSLHDIPGYTAPQLSCHFQSWYNGSDVLFKKFPLRMHELGKDQWQTSKTFDTWPLLPNDVICAKGTLTSRGCLQHLNLGRHFSRAYLHLLDLRQPIKDQLNIRSTNTHRTYQSVLALLYGFLPDFQLSNIIIENAPSIYFCNRKSWIKDTCYCKYALELRNGYKRFETMVESKSKNVTRFYKEIRDAFDLGVDISKSIGLSSVADSLVPEICHDLSHLHQSPDWKQNFNRKLISDIWAEMKEEFAEHLNDPDKQRDKHSSLSMLPVLTEISEWIRDLAERKQTPKLWIYSGHDLTITSLLFVLGLHDGIWPPYASRVVMEIFENEAASKSDRIYMKFLYNGRDVTENVIFCRNVTYLGLCPVKYFEDYVLHTLIQRFGFTSYNDACKR